MVDVDVCTKYLYSVLREQDQQKVDVDKERNNTNRQGQQLSLH